MNPFSTFLNRLQGQSKTTFTNPYTPTASTTPSNGTPINQSPKPTVVSSNTAATTPKTTSINTPAAKTFINNGVTTPTTPQYYDNSTGARTDAGKAAGVADMLGGKPVSPSGNPATPTTPTTPTTTDPYMLYLQSLFNPDSLKTAQNNVNQLNQRTSDELLSARNKEDELRKNDIGQLSAGQNYGITENARLSNKSLADLAIAKGANTDIINQISDAGKSLYDIQKDKDAATTSSNKPIEVNGALYQLQPDGSYKAVAGTPGGTSSTSGFTLQPGETRYDANGKVIASGGPKPPTQAQETAQIANTEKEKAAQQSSSQSIGLVNGLLSGDAYKSITGIGQNPLNAFGLTNGKSINDYNQLQGLLKLGVRSLLKGQGAVSDYEGKILGQAASDLGRNLSNEDFHQSLLKIRGVLQTNNGGDTNVIVKDKNGKVIGQGSLTGQDIYDAVNDGNTIQYLD